MEKSEVGDWRLDKPLESGIIENGDNFNSLRADIIREALGRANKIPAFVQYMKRHDRDVQDQIFSVLFEVSDGTVLDAQDL